MMNRDNIIRMAQESSGVEFPISMDGVKIGMSIEHLERFAALVAAALREKVAEWMIQRSYATGHGETIEDLLAELDWQIVENWNRAMIKGIETEREACAKVCEELLTMVSTGDEHMDGVWDCATAIRARGQG